MEQNRNNILEEDIGKLLESNLDFELLKNKTVLVTGATGLIGSFLIKALLKLNHEKNTNIHLCALVRDTAKAKTMFESAAERAELELLEADILEELSYPGTIDYMIHGASVTDSASFVQKPVETIEVTLAGLKHVLELAKIKQVKSFVYLSSMEVYGVTDETLTSVTETDYGYLDPLEVRSSYSEGKRMAECLCCAYAKEYQMNIKIARLVQTFGAGVRYEDNRVFAQFARAVIEERDIVLHTKGETVRSYCYISDAAEGILYVLLKGENGQAYNVANTEATLSIYQMARMLAERYTKTNVRIEESDIQRFGYNPVVKMKMDISKIQTLGWRPSVGIEEAFERLIASMCLEKDRSNE